MNLTKPYIRIDLIFIFFILFFLPYERETFFISLRLKIVDFIIIPFIILKLLLFFLKEQNYAFPLITPVWLILIGSLSSIIFGLLSNFSYTVGTIAILQEVYLYTFFIILYNTLKDVTIDIIQTLMKFWCVIAVVVSTTTFMGMMGIGPSSFYSDPVEGTVLTIDGFNRGYGTFANPNAAAVYLCISFFILISLKLPVIIRCFMGAWILLGIYSTGSHGGLLSVIISFLTLTVLSFSFKEKRRFIVLISILCIGVFVSSILVFFKLFIWPSHLTPIETSSDSRSILDFASARLSHSLGSRIQLLKKAYTIFKANPFGTGPNTSVTYLGTLHNDYIAFLFERGPIGFIGLLWLTITTIFTSFHTAFYENNRLQSWMMLVLGIGFFACIINAFTHEVTHFRQVWTLMAFLFATMNIIRDKENLSANNQYLQRKHIYTPKNRIFLNNQQLYRS